MRTRTRLVFGSLAGAVAVHIVLVACSASSSITDPRDGAVVDAPDFSDVVDAMAAGDLGRALDVAADAAVDVLGDLGRAETSDAHAGGGPATEVACTETAVQLIAQTGVTTVVTSYYAVVPTTAAGRDVPDLRAVVCDPVEDPSPCRPYAATPSVMCNLSGFATSRSTCVQANVIFDAGRALVPCGGVVESRTGSGTTTSGFHYRHAFVRLP